MALSPIQRIRDSFFTFGVKLRSKRGPRTVRCDPQSLSLAAWEAALLATPSPPEYNSRMDQRNPSRARMAGLLAILVYVGSVCIALGFPFVRHYWGVLGDWSAMAG